MTFRRRASPLHAARPAVAAAFCAVLAGAALATHHAVVLAALLGIVLAAATGAQVGRELWGPLRLGLVLGALMALANPFVSANGLTVLFRLGDVPVLVDDLTLEALVEGAVLGLRVVVVVAASALGALCVDPDAVLAGCRRLSLRSALTASLATRLVPVLARDAGRVAEAQRARAGGGPQGARGRLALVRAVTGGALDRAVDVAATLEVRGYGTARAARRAHVPWSRHDLAFGTAVVALLVLVIGARVAGVAEWRAFPTLAVDLGPAEGALVVALAVVALAPFLARRGIE